MKASTIKNIGYAVAISGGPIVWLTSPPLEMGICIIVAQIIGLVVALNTKG